MVTRAIGIGVLSALVSLSGGPASAEDEVAGEPGAEGEASPEEEAPGEEEPGPEAEPEISGEPVAAEYPVNLGPVEYPAASAPRAPANVPPPSLSAPPPPVDLPPLYDPRAARDPGRVLIICGWIALGAGYGASLLTGFVISADYTPGYFYYIPIVGGYIVGGKFIYENTDSTGSRFLGLYAMLPSFAQTAGLIVALVGYGKRSRWEKERGIDVALAPVGPAGSGGLSLDLRF